MLKSGWKMANTSLPPGLAPMQRMLALEQHFFLVDHNLLDTDKMSMAAGVEVCVPLLDNDLVRLTAPAASTPPTPSWGWYASRSGAAGARFDSRSDRHGLS